MKDINSPLVSVLMTAYNREKYIAEAIESVIVSTYQKLGTDNCRQLYKLLLVLVIKIKNGTPC